MTPPYDIPTGQPPTPDPVEQLLWLIQQLCGTEQQRLSAYFTRPLQGKKDQDRLKASEIRAEIHQAFDDCFKTWLQEILARRQANLPRDSFSPYFYGTIEILETFFERPQHHLLEEVSAVLNVIRPFDGPIEKYFFPGPERHSPVSQVSSLWEQWKEDLRLFGVWKSLDNQPRPRGKHRSLDWKSVAHYNAVSDAVEAELPWACRRLSARRKRQIDIENWLCDTSSAPWEGERPETEEGRWDERMIVANLTERLQEKALNEPLKRLIETNSLGETIRTLACDFLDLFEKLGRFSEEEKAIIDRVSIALEKTTGAAQSGTFLFSLKGEEDCGGTVTCTFTISETTISFTSRVVSNDWGESDLKFPGESDENAGSADTFPMAALDEHHRLSRDWEIRYRFLDNLPTDAGKTFCYFDYE
jgi:hypothetical protein